MKKLSTKGTLSSEKILSKDPIMRQLVKSCEPVEIGNRRIYPSLIRSIIGQQLSKAAATSIFKRLTTIATITPGRLQKLDIDSYRACGISKQKANYIKAISEIAVAGKLRNISKLSDDVVIHNLLQLPGVGHWTAQMVLIFSCGREDVWPHADAGLLRATKGLYNIQSTEEFMALGDRFRPYRSHAAWYLWRSLDDK